MNKTDSTKPIVYNPPPRPQKIPFYMGLGQPTLPRYVWLKKNNNKYNGDGTLKVK